MTLVASIPLVLVERVVTLFAVPVYIAPAQARFEAAMEASLVKGSK